MEDVLDERLSKLESRLGLKKAGSVINVNEELSVLRRKLSEAGYGFLLKIPTDLLRKINDLATGVSFFFFLFSLSFIRLSHIIYCLILIYLVLQFRDSMTDLAII